MPRRGSLGPTVAVAAIELDATRHFLVQLDIDSHILRLCTVHRQNGQSQVDDARRRCILGTQCLRSSSRGTAISAPDANHLHLTPQLQVEDVTEGNIEDVSYEDMQKYMAGEGKAWSGDSTKSNLPLKVDVNVSFPDAEIFGVKMVNGRPTRALLHITNNEDSEINVLIATAGLFTPLDTPGMPDPPQNLRNLTGAKFGTVIPAKSKETLTYAFATVMQPQDLTLQIQTVIARAQQMYTLTIFRENVSIVEAPVSFFDPQM